MGLCRPNQGIQLVKSWRLAVSAAICLVWGSGCASVRMDQPAEGPCASRFDLVGVYDQRVQELDDFRKMAKPGDLIVNVKRRGRAVRQRDWLFGLLPHGHSMIVLDPWADDGLIECRYRGAQPVGADQLDQNSYNLIYRLREPERLHLPRLAEFARTAVAKCNQYSFRSWVGLNDNMEPNTLEDISPAYTCSTMVVAAYHYAGLSLAVCDAKHRVITPISVASSAGYWNHHSLPAGWTHSCPRFSWQPAPPDVSQAPSGEQILALPQDQSRDNANK